MKKTFRPGRFVRRVVAVTLCLVVAGTACAGALQYYKWSETEVDYSWLKDFSTGEMTIESKAGNLQALANLVNGDYVVSEVLEDSGLQLDGSAIDFEGKTVKFAETWHPSFFGGYTMTPIGKDADHAFNGTFDGNGKTISWLYLNSEDASAPCDIEYVGVFGHIGKEGVVKNLTIGDTCAVNVKGKNTSDHVQYIGSVAGMCEGKLENCVNKAEVKVSWDDGNGGGKRKGANAAVIDGVGGVAGYCDGDISACVNKASVKVSTPANAYYVTASQSNITNVVKYVGGVVGRSGGDPAQAGDKRYSHGNVTECTNSGELMVVTSGAGGTDRFGETVDSKSLYVGGVAGYAVGTVSNCQNTADVTGTSYIVDEDLDDTEDDTNMNGLLQANGGADSCGGIVGGYRSEGSSSVFATDEAKTRNDKYFKNKEGVGVDRGIMGAEAGQTDEISIISCSNMGRIIACNNVGGIVGSTGTYTTVESCYNGDAKQVTQDEYCGYVMGSRWNKPYIGGLVGRCNGDVCYSRNHGEVTTAKGGYYVAGLVGGIDFFQSGNGTKLFTGEVWASYNTGQCSGSARARRGTLVGYNGGYVHDCLYLYGSGRVLEDDGDANNSAEEASAIGYAGNAGSDGTNARLKVAFPSEEQLASAGGEDDFLLKSSTAVAWLNASAPRDGGWSSGRYWMRNASVNKGYPVLKSEGYNASGSMDLTSLNPTVEWQDDARYSASYNPTPTVKVTLTVGDEQSTLVENADYFVVADPDAVDAKGVCRGVTNGERPYTAQVTGIGAYQGTVGSAAYGIVSGSFSECSLSVANGKYNGEAQNNPQVTVVDAVGGVIDSSLYEVVVNDGKDCVYPTTTFGVVAKATGGNYTGSCSGTYTIDRIDIMNDCDVIGVTFDDSDNGRGNRIWFYDDETFKTYEVKPVLDASGEFTTYTFDVLKALNEQGKWGLDETQLEAYVGYPVVEGFSVYREDDAIDGRLLTSATPMHVDEDGNRVTGMSIDYTGADLHPEVIGVTWSQGKLSNTWWKSVYGGGVGGSTISGENNQALEGVKNIEASVTGAVTVAYRSVTEADGVTRAYTSNYDVITFDIDQANATADDFDIEQTTTIFKYANGRQPVMNPTIDLKYKGNVVDPANYKLVLVKEIDANGKERKSSFTYNIGDTFYYKIQFVKDGSIVCDDIEEIDGKPITCVVADGQKNIDTSTTIATDPEVCKYTLSDGATVPSLIVKDNETGVILKEGRDYRINIALAAKDMRPQSEEEAKDKGLQRNKISIQGMNGYTGYTSTFVIVEKPVLTSGYLQQIANGDIADVKLVNVNSAGLDKGSVSDYSLSWPYRVNGYTKEDFTTYAGYLSYDEGKSTGPYRINQGIAVCWNTSNRSDMTAWTACGLFEVTDIKDSQGNSVAAAKDLGSYTLSLKANSKANSTKSAENDYKDGFQFFELDDGVSFEVNIVIEKADLSSGQDWKPWSAKLNLKQVDYTYKNTEYPYTGNAVQPAYSLVDSSYIPFYTSPNFEDGSEAAGWDSAKLKEWIQKKIASISFNRDDYEVVTEGHEAAGGPTEPGNYQVTAIRAAAGSSRLSGLYEISASDKSANKYSIVAANLDQGEGKVVNIDVADGYYTGAGAKPEVTFKTVYGDACNYIEGEDYALEYKNNKDVGTGTVRIVVLNTDHLTASQRDEQGRPYVEVDFEIKGKQVALNDMSAVDWSLPEKLSLSDANSSTLSNLWSKASYVAEDGTSEVEVPQDAYTLVTGIYDEQTKAFTEKTEGWQAEDVVYFQVQSTGKYARYIVDICSSSGNPAAIVGQTAVIAAENVNDLGQANNVGSNITASLDKASVTYTGASVAPNVTVKDDDAVLIEGQDYILDYSESVNVGDCAVKVSGKGAYHGQCSLAFNIEPAVISNEGFKLEAADFAYMGSRITPQQGDMKLVLNGIELSARDWTVAGYGENVNAGKGTVTIKPGQSGNLSGSNVEFEFKISRIAFDESTLEVACKSKSYTGSDVYLGADDVTVTYKTASGSKELEYGTDFKLGFPADNDYMQKGSKKVSIIGTGNYTGSITKIWYIKASNLSSAIVAVAEGKAVDGKGNSTGDWSYTGKAVEPDVTVALNGVELSSDDYKVTYQDNVVVGTAKAIITGKGNCTGTTNGTFTIAPTYIGDKDIEFLQDEYVFTGKAVEPKVRVKADGVTVPSSEYSLAYADVNGNVLETPPTKCGVYSVKIVSKTTNLEVIDGVSYHSFQIVKAGIEACSAKISSEYNYSKEPEVSVSLTTPQGEAVDPENYTYSCEFPNGYDIGSAVKVSFTATADGSLKDSCDFEGEISKITLDKTDIKILDGGKYTYTGAEITPKLSIVHQGHELVEGNDYELNCLTDKKSVGGHNIEVVCPESSIYQSNGVTINYSIVNPDDPEPAKPTITTGLSKGNTFKVKTSVGTFAYKVTATKQVSLTKAASTKAKPLTINSVKYGSITYKVTSIAKNACKSSKFKKVTLGANVRTVGDKAFVGAKKLASFIVGKNVSKFGKQLFKNCSKLKIIIVKSKKLTTKKSVSNCLKGSKISKVKLSGLGGKKANVKKIFNKYAGKKIKF